MLILSIFMMLIGLSTLIHVRLFILLLIMSSSIMFDVLFILFFSLTSCATRLFLVLNHFLMLAVFHSCQHCWCSNIFHFLSYSIAIIVGQAVWYAVTISTIWSSSKPEDTLSSLPPFAKSSTSSYHYQPKTPKFSSYYLTTAQNYLYTDFLNPEFVIVVDN